MRQPRATSAPTTDNAPSIYADQAAEARRAFTSRNPPAETPAEQQVRVEIPSCKGLGWAKRIVRLKELGHPVDDYALRKAQAAIAETT